jgi:UDP-N-acetylmuramoylalanine--D-glutamate ligase
MQTECSYAVFGIGDDETASIAGMQVTRHAPGRVRFADGRDLAELQKDWPSLQGPHNLQNAAVAIAIVEALGLTREQWLPAMANFRGLPHRMERVAEANGVLFINDSKATNPASTAPALAAFPPVDRGLGPEPRIHWIVGGLPKGEDLGECAPHFGNVAAAYTIGDAGPMFAELLKPHMKVCRSEMMAEAIREAIAQAKPGDVIMLSPACDYEARGDAFRQIVGALIPAQGEG